MGLPMSSCAVYPNSRSAPLFQLLMTPSRSLLTMASSSRAHGQVRRPRPITGSAFFLRSARGVGGGGFIGRDGDLEIVVSWRLIKDSGRGGSRGRNRRARSLPRAKRRVDAVNQIIVAKWFWQVANNSETEGLGSNIFIRLSGNQNGGNAAAKRLEAAV